MVTALSSLDTPSLLALLARSAGEERDRQVDFLLYLAEFDAREAYRGEACSSLWVYCTRVLRLREGSAGRRIGAMRVLRDFPELEAPLRDGRLSMTTAVTLRQVLTRENLPELVAQAAYLSDAETAHLVATLRPRPPPREGIRRISAPASPRKLAPAAPEPAPAAFVLEAPVAPVPVPAPRAELEPCSSDLFSLRVDMDSEFKADLERLRAVRRHVHRTGNLSAILHEAVKRSLEHYGRKLGAVEPSRTVAPRQREDGAPPPSGGRPAIPMWMKRAVWKRDGGQCTFCSKVGARCEEREGLEVDHIEPWALGGPTTVANLRLRCIPHNGYAAEAVFGRVFMLERRGRLAPKSQGEAGDGPPTAEGRPKGTPATEPTPFDAPEGPELSLAIAHSE